MEPAASPLLVERAGAVTVLCLDRPEAANALDSRLHRALVAGLERAVADDLDAVVLAGGERIFCAGADLKEYADHDAAEAGDRRRDLLMNTLMTLLDCGRPVVAAVKGKALGAGCMLAMLADETVVGEAAQYVFPEIGLGMPSPVGIELAMARGGRAAAHRLVQGGAALDAATLHAMGLVDAVVPAAEVTTRAAARAEALAALDHGAFAANKRWMNARLRRRLAEAAAQAAHLQEARLNG